MPGDKEKSQLVIALTKPSITERFISFPFKLLISSTLKGLGKL